MYYHNAHAIGREQSLPYVDEICSHLVVCYRTPDEGGFDLQDIVASHTFHWVRGDGAPGQR